MRANFEKTSAFPVPRKITARVFFNENKIYRLTKLKIIYDLKGEEKWDDYFDLFDCFDFL